MANYEVYILNTEQKEALKNRIYKWYSKHPCYFVDDLIPGIIDYYIRDENDTIKKIFEQNCIKERRDIRSYIINYIKEHNTVREERKRGYTGLLLSKAAVEGEGVKIPSNIVFFKEAFPLLLVRGGNTLTTVAIDSRELDAMSFNDELESIVADKSIKRIDEISAASQEEIRKTLNRFGVYLSQRFAKESIIDGIKIFQMEYMGKPLEECQGNLDKGILVAMNTALNREWQIPTASDRQGFRVTVSKAAGTLVAAYTPSRNYDAEYEGVNAYNSMRIVHFDVITNVVKDVPNNTAASDTKREQTTIYLTNKYQTRPTQIQNGTYNLSIQAISGGVNSAPKYKYGTPRNSLHIDFTQWLKSVYNQGELVLDGGYMIHITPYRYTDGCIGVKYTEDNLKDNGDSRASRQRAEDKMSTLVDWCGLALSRKEPATITIKD